MQDGGYRHLQFPRHSRPFIHHPYIPDHLWWDYCDSDKECIRIVKNCSGDPHSRMVTADIL